ncbi:hypothetical protein [Paenibacillus larvae]|nr:hypothetical protein [Paenibacillus larvae]MDT2194904.1 hypothetical protein [Paenibacillus larvae]MDT2237418.1 hypothetical protein [Paenibacillus larvae]MDT2241438.1 hypothetical protein [Paenibacillus larvae]
MEQKKSNPCLKSSAIPVRLKGSLGMGKGHFNRCGISDSHSLAVVRPFHC